MFLTFLFRSNPEEGLNCKPKYRAKKFVFLKNKYISVILAFVVCSLKLVTSAVGISLPLIFCTRLEPSRTGVNLLNVREFWLLWGDITNLLRSRQSSYSISGFIVGASSCSEVSFALEKSRIRDWRQ